MEKLSSYSSSDSNHLEPKHVTKVCFTQKTEKREFCELEPTQPPLPENSGCKKSNINKLKLDLSVSWQMASIPSSVQLGVATKERITEHKVDIRDRKIQEAEQKQAVSTQKTKLKSKQIRCKAEQPVQSKAVVTPNPLLIIDAKSPFEMEESTWNIRHYPAKRKQLKPKSGTEFTLKRRKVKNLPSWNTMKASKINNVPSWSRLKALIVPLCIRPTLIMGIGPDYAQQMREQAQLRRYAMDDDTDMNLEPLALYNVPSAPVLERGKRYCGNFYCQN